MDREEHSVCRNSTGKDFSLRADTNSCTGLERMLRTFQALIKERVKYLLKIACVLLSATAGAEHSRPDARFVVVVVYLWQQ